MNTFFRALVLHSLLLLAVCNPSHALMGPGFSLPDSLRELIIRYRSLDNLIILPVKINDSINVNLILDTGCRNVVLFGKRFQNMFTIMPNRIIEFSGVGNERIVKGSLSLGNKVSIDAVVGTEMPVVVVHNKTMFSTLPGIDGIIGYDIFTRFEVELDPANRLITFRSAYTNFIPPGFARIPIRVTDSKPVISSIIFLHDNVFASDLLIDTGSALGLLIKSTDKSWINRSQTSMLGTGLSGAFQGLNTRASKVKVDNYEITDLETGIIHSSYGNDASIGMGVLKNYVIILNYMQNYACLKRMS